ncbi:MAG TPA: lipocalin family protein [Fimbriimonadaceae bacterium]|nr:lipocalin family protein [Fimbriimonadaceae bacterium]
MRRTIRAFSLLLVAASSGIIAVGCGGLTDIAGLERLFPPGTFGSGANSPFVGQWTLTSITVNGVSVNCPGSTTQNGTNYSCDAIVRSFIANGTFNDTAPSQDIGSGTWSVTGSDLTLTKGGVITSGTVGFTADLSKFVVTVGAENMNWTKH